MTSIQYVLAITSPPLSPPPLPVSSKSSRSTTPLAGNIIHTAVDLTPPSEQIVEIRSGDESKMENHTDLEPEGERPSSPAPEPLKAIEPSPLRDITACETLSIFETADLLRERRYQRDRCRRLQGRVYAAQKSAAITPRLVRTSEHVRRALVELFKQGDQANFVSGYNALHGLREACKTTWKAQPILDDTSLVSSGFDDSHFNISSSFLDKLSTAAKNDILEFLHLVRTRPDFLVDRINCLSPSQLLALTSTRHATIAYESVLPPPSRGRSQASNPRRGMPTFSGIPDLVSDFERTDPLAVLLFNVYDLSHGPESSDARLRADVWSSICAKLLVGSGSTYDRFISDLATAWSTSREWSVKPRLELCLMDILEKGAFLLERVDDSHVGFHRPSTAPDPLSTQVAEEFFESSVQDLLEVLDEANGGMPSGALDFCNAILCRLEDQHTRDRFREFVFLQWYFSRCLVKVLIHPEEEGMLLGFHVKKDARQLLHRVAFRVRMQAYETINPRPNFSNSIPASSRGHLLNMFSKICPTPENPKEASSMSVSDSIAATPIVALSALDVHTVLSALFPPTDRGLFPWDRQSDRQSIRSISSSFSSLPFRPGSFGLSSRPPSVFDVPLPGKPAAPESFSAEFSSFANPSSTIPLVVGESSQGEQTDLTNGEGSPPTPVYHDLYLGLEQALEELTSLVGFRGHRNQPHPCSEDWILLSFKRNENALSVSCNTGPSSQVEILSDVEPEVPTHYDADIEEDVNRKRLESMIVELVDEIGALEEYQIVRALDGSRNMTHDTLDKIFEEARIFCQSQSDFVKAHHWWEARSLLYTLRGGSSTKAGTDDVLRTLIWESRQSIERSLASIASFEKCSTYTQKSIRRSEASLKMISENLAYLRDKMWYETDVKHSKWYEEARNVALALKTMGYPTARFRQYPGGRTGSILHNPEMQTMNIMKTSSEQGGPNKLADEQVDRTRKWLKRYGIENFCQGEERIHRFCLEIKTSVTKIVGESMTDGAVLWASDLFQAEKTLYDAQVTRPPSIRNGVRPSSITSEDSLFTVPSIGPFVRTAEFQPRIGSESHLAPSTLSPSFISERWKTARDRENFETGSIDDSPGKAVSTSTAESYNTFWSPNPAPIRSSTSVSSFRSRPSSVYNESIGVRGMDRASSAKLRFLENLKQTLTSLLLSDLGSPVWSTGSETDAWFSPSLAQERVRRQAREAESPARPIMRRGSTRSLNDLPRLEAESIGSPATHKRSRSVQPSQSQWLTSDFEAPQTQAPTSDGAESDSSPIPEPFSFEYAFHKLLEKFSRHSNPFTKLDALHELRLLILASLNTDPIRKGVATGSCKERARHVDTSKSEQSPHTPESQIGDAFVKHTSIFPPIHPPLLPNLDSPIWSRTDGLLERSVTTNPVIEALQDLLRWAAPKTLFRDLQFIAAFVPSDILNRTERGVAFLDTGVAALSLKQDICQSMVDIADGIVARELDRRPPMADSVHKRDYTLADAAKMWIITAKEGHAVAQRELGILYLTHPELLPRVTLPLTMPKETFKAEMMYRRNEDMKRSDPQTMCLALHWMQLSANNGDELARRNLRAREEFDSIP